MKTLWVDAIRLEAVHGQPEVVQAADGRQYHVLGFGTEQLAVALHVEASVPPGRRVYLILGERVADPPAPDKAAGPTPEQRGSGV